MACYIALVIIDRRFSSIILNKNIQLVYGLSFWKFNGTFYENELRIISSLPLKFLVMQPDNYLLCQVFS